MDLSIGIKYMGKPTGFKEFTRELPTKVASSGAQKKL